MTVVDEVPPPRVEVHAPERGSVLEVARGGVPGGRPVVLHHGLVGGAILSEDWHAWAVAADVELVVPARPGYGRSDPLDMGRVSTWSALLLPVLERLGVDGEVGSLGVSAGAAYALALAAGLPGQVGRVGVLSGVAHVPDPAVLAHYRSEAREGYARFGRASLTDVAEEMRAVLAPRVEALAGDDAPEWRRALEATLAHDGLGPAREARLQIRAWGFDLDDVRQPVRWWHARDDDEVPFAAAEATVAGLAHGTLLARDRGGHLATDAECAAALAWVAGVEEGAVVGPA